MITKKMIILIGMIAATPLALWVGWGLFTITTTKRPPYEGDSSSFRVLASYIFGGNEQGQRVAMTAPVITDEKMAFILPGGVTPESAPTPAGQPIDFIEVPPRKLATLTFSWTTPDERVERKTGELLALLESHGVRTKGKPFLMRRNEIAVEVVQ